jgi:transglutaminase-like putative cysteine protease
MRLTIHHETTYDYPRAVVNSVNEAWLRPLTDEKQSCLSFRLTTRPSSDPRPYTDYFGNTVYHFDVQNPHTQLAIIADADVLTLPFDAQAALAADSSPFRPLSSGDSDQWLDFLLQTPLTTSGPLVQAITNKTSGEHETVSALILDLAESVHQGLRYEQGGTDVGTDAEAALRLGAGVCQDYTHVFIAACRKLGVPSRYVSGYLCSDGEGGQAQASHAWPEVLLPATGWVGVDVTNACLVDERYVRIAVGRDYSDIPPVRGAYSGSAGAGPDVAVTVLAQQQ